MVSSIFAADLFRGRVALISGGGTGIGLRTAKEFMQLGGSVIIASRKADVIAAAAQQLNTLYPPFEGYRPRCLGTTVNIREPASIAALVELIRSSGLVGSALSVSPAPAARVDYLLNNGGGQFPSLAADMSSKGWNAVVDTNLTGSFLLSQAIFNNFFVPQSQQASSLPVGGFAVVSVVANMHNGFPGMSHTGAARAGVVNLTKSLCVEWASSGVRVNALAPGVIQSSGLDRYDPAMRAMIAANAKNNIYAARLGTEAECAAAILYLLSPAAAFISGACLNMDGGESLYAPMMPPTPHSLNTAWDDFAPEDTATQQQQQAAKESSTESAPSKPASAAASAQTGTRSPTPYAPRANAAAIVSKL